MMILQKMIFRDDLVKNRQVVYLFGDNEQRTGLGGQAKEMRGEPNAHGVRTKRSPDAREESYWTDRNYERNVFLLDEDLARAIGYLALGGIVVLPSDGLGTGLSKLPIYAPRTYAYLESRVKYMMKIGNPFMEKA